MEIKKRLRGIFLLALSLCVLVLGSASAARLPAPPDITAETAILVEASTGRVIYEKNADRLMYPASMTKMMTCILALERWKDMSAPIAVGYDAADTESTDLSAGDVLSMGELLMALMMESDNGAAVAIAEEMAPNGGVEEFSADMTKKAWQIGAVKTRFANPSGLPNVRHVTTARDMAKIARYGWTNREFRRIVGTKEYSLVWDTPEGKKTRTLENTNSLLGVYPGMEGLKTGWTRDAGGCLAGAATRNGVTLISIVMNAPSADDRFSDTARLMDYGFPLVRTVKGPSKEKLARSVFVHHGSTYKITARPKENVKYTLMEGEDARKFSVRYDIPKFVIAPIKEGEKVGDLVVLYDGKEVSRIDMVADKSLQKGFSPMAMVLDLCGGFLSPFVM